MDQDGVFFNEMGSSWAFNIYLTTAGLAIFNINRGWIIPKWDHKFLKHKHGYNVNQPTAKRNISSDDNTFANKPRKQFYGIYA